VPNTVSRRDLQIPIVKEEIRRYSSQNVLVQTANKMGLQKKNVKTVTAATSAHATIENSWTLFSSVHSALYERKADDEFFPELLVYVFFLPESMACFRVLFIFIRTA
jgi:hypothetical protein